MNQTFRRKIKNIYKKLVWYSMQGIIIITLIEKCLCAILWKIANIGIMMMFNWKINQTELLSVF